ncbi:hypothetical protein Bca4012_070601 [Brassica carinata]
MGLQPFRLRHREETPGRCSPYIKDFGHLCQDGRSGFEAYVVSHNLLVSHAEAVDAFRKCEKCKGGKIGIAHSPAWFEPEDVEGGQRTVDRVLDFIMGWHLDPTTSFYAKASEKPDYRQPSWATDSLVEFEPDLRKLVKYIKDRYGNPEIIITENGYGEDLGVKDTDHSVALNDHNRKYYHQRHLLALHQAICEDKVNVTSYFVWSLMDNFEWQDGYTASHRERGTSFSPSRRSTEREDINRDADSSRREIETSPPRETPTDSSSGKDHETEAESSRFRENEEESSRFRERNSESSRERKREPESSRSRTTRSRRGFNRETRSRRERRKEAESSREKKREVDSLREKKTRLMTHVSLDTFLVRLN